MVDGLQGLRLYSLCKPSPRAAPWDTIHGGQEHHAIQGNHHHGASNGCSTSVHASLWTQWSVHQAKTPYGQLVYHRCCLARRPAQRLDVNRAARCRQSARRHWISRRLVDQWSCADRPQQRQPLWKSPAAPQAMDGSAMAGRRSGRLRRATSAQTYVCNGSDVTVGARRSLQFTLGAFFDVELDFDLKNGCSLRRFRVIAIA